MPGVRAIQLAAVQPGKNVNGPRKSKPVCRGRRILVGSYQRLPSENHFFLHQRDELIHRAFLDSPAIGLIARGITLKVLPRRLVALKVVLQPGDTGAAELAAVVGEQITTVSKGEVTLPSWGADWKSLEVSLGLHGVLRISYRSTITAAIGRGVLALAYATSPDPPMT